MSKKMKFGLFTLLFATIIFTAANCSEIQDQLKQMWEQQQGQDQEQQTNPDEF